MFNSALYPIVSLIVNYSTTALDLNVAIQGLNTQLVFAFPYRLVFSPTDFSFISQDFRLLILGKCFSVLKISNQCADSSLDLFLYGIRTLFYGLLAAFDPVSHTVDCTEPIQLNIHL